MKLRPRLKVCLPPQDLNQRKLSSGLEIWTSGVSFLHFGLQFIPVIGEWTTKSSHDSGKTVTANSSCDTKESVLQTQQDVALVNSEPL